MIETKLFEVRDCGTFIPCFGIRCATAALKGLERYLMRRAGFSDDIPCVLFGSLYYPRNAHWDPFEHGPGGRTMQAAHLHIEKHWDELESGVLIDVEFLLGETNSPKQSEFTPR